MAIKTFVQVEHQTNQLGDIIPLCLKFHFQRYVINRVLEVRLAAAMNVGGTGVRFTVRIDQRKTFLFLDDHDRCFVEERVLHEIPRVGGLVHGQLGRF